MTTLSEENAIFAREQLANGCDTMERLLSGLLNSKGRVAEEVHAIRKLGKSLRGGFSLFGLKAAAKEIQAIGRLLSEPRNAVSRLSTWGKIDWNEDVVASSAIGGLLEQLTHSAARRPPPETIAWCVERVDAAREFLAGVTAENLVERLNSGAKKLSKQVKKRCTSLDYNGEENFHDARKALKAYLGGIGLFPEGTHSIDPNMNELAEILGDENDLATLSNWLEAHGFTDRFVPTLWLTIGKLRHKLRKQAYRDAKRLLAAAGS